MRKEDKKVYVKRCGHRKCLLAALLAAQLLFLLACGGEGNTKVVLTTGFAADEVFRIETISCKLPEFMVYLTTTQNRYEDVYGEEIWNASLDGVTLEENVKEIVLAKIAQIKTLNLLAQEKGVALDEQELALVELAAAEYFDSLNDTEIALLGVKPETVRQMYAEYALAEKVYKEIIQDINPEISDDEARIITVQHILIKTYIIDGSGTRVEYTQSAKEAAYRRALEIWEYATDGEHDFEELVAQYSEDRVGTYSFGKGEMPEAFEEASFNLGMNEISGIVEDEYGYHIIKCINTFDRLETDQNKLVIVEQRKQEVFGEEYDVFVDTLTRKLNEELWEQVSFIRDEEVKTADFFDIYARYFPAG